MNAALQRLRAEIAFDCAAFEQRLAQLAGLTLDPRSEPATEAQAAEALHYAYCAIESMLVRVAPHLQRRFPKEPTDIKLSCTPPAWSYRGGRPPILSRWTVEALRPLLGFRHFFVTGTQRHWIRAASRR